VGLFLIGVICFLLVAADNSIISGSDLRRRLGVQVVGEVPLLSTHLERRAEEPRKAQSRRFD
jgi:capsular polysaccharide biosynthesis protein